MKKQHKKFLIELNAALDRMIELKKLDNQSRELKLKELEKVSFPKYLIPKSSLTTAECKAISEAKKKIKLSEGGSVSDFGNEVDFGTMRKVRESFDKQKSEFNPEEVEKPDSKIQMSEADWMKGRHEAIHESLGEILEKGRKSHENFFEELSTMFKPDNQK